MGAAEEQVAAEYRAQQKRRAQFRHTLARQLAGNSSAAAAVRGRWAWLLRPPADVPDPPTRCDPPTNAD